MNLKTFYLHPIISNLHVTRVPYSYYSRTCGYWFIVRSNHSAHTAFATKAGFMQWMAERGLWINGVISPEPKESEKLGDNIHENFEIFGGYRECSWMNQEEFDKIGEDLPKELVINTRQLSNGDYTKGKILIDPETMQRVVHYCNPNVKTRKGFEYFESRKLMD